MTQIVVIIASKVTNITETTQSTDARVWRDLVWYGVLYSMAPE